MRPRNSILSSRAKRGDPVTANSASGLPRRFAPRNDTNQASRCPLNPVTHKKKSPCIIGLTGGIATGKSTVSTMLKELGYPVICADTIVHELSGPGRPAFKRIIGLFGGEILNSDGTLDRKRIATTVFRDSFLRQRLEKTLHPLVRQEMQRQIRTLQTRKPKLIILDVPLLFESGFDKICDIIFCIAATQKNQIARLTRRRKMLHTHALQRIRAQMPLKQKIHHADFVIVNNDTKCALKKKLYATLESLYKSTHSIKRP